MKYYCKWREKPITSHAIYVGGHDLEQGAEGAVVVLII